MKQYPHPANRKQWFNVIHNANTIGELFRMEQYIKLPEVKARLIERLKQITKTI